MKNQLILKIALLHAVFLNGFNPVVAQVDKQAADILKNVSAKYKSFSSIHAEFSYTLDDPKEKSKSTQFGNISLKGEKYRLEITGQEVTCDGKTLWTFLKEANEVQISEPEKNADAVTPSTIFTLYEKGFDFKYMEEKSENGKQIEVIDIMPQDKKKNFFKIRMKIDKNEKLIISTDVFNKNGTHAIYAIKKFTPNTPLPDSDFLFDKAKHPGIEVVDLR